MTTGTIKYVIGLVSITAFSVAYGSVSSKSTAQCGGLFLLDTKTAEVSGTRCHVTDSVSVGKYTAFGSFGHYRFGGTWNDGWELSIKSNGLIGSAGIRVGFKYIDFSVDANSLYSMTSGMSIHKADSSAYMASFIGMGHPTLASIRWDSDDDNSEISHIAADWETDFFRKGVIIGAQFGKQYVNAKIESIITTPYSANREYFVKDSSHLAIADIHYSFDGTDNDIRLHYTNVIANLNIIGNTYRDSSTKRFMFVPLDANLHLAELSWERLHYALHASALRANAQMEKKDERFFETFAPNRLLAPSIIQALSFTFLQQVYRVGADIDIFAFAAGAKINPRLNIAGHTIVPSIDIQGYYTYDEMDVEKTSETTRLIAFDSRKESWHWQLESFGTIISLGLSWEKSFAGSSHTISLDWNASQIVPLDFDFSKEYSDGESERNSDKSLKTRSGTGLFRNGFASSLAIRYSF